MTMLLIAGLPLLCLLLYGVFLLHISRQFGRIAGPPAGEATLPFVSLIIPARNEAMNLPACLECALAQDYPKGMLEIIVVNDHSEDGTRMVADAYARIHPHLRVLDLPTQQGEAYKKAAVAHGISHSTGEIILTTDADCTADPQWVRSMASHFTPGVGLVSGPVLLTGRSLFARFQTLEFMGLIAVGAGSIQAGRPNMCNGANLAYRRDAYEAVGGFTGLDRLASGDDEFLMHRIAAAGKHRLVFAKDARAIVRTAAQPDLRGFLQQRRRWVSKSTHYARKAITLTLVMAYLAMLLFPYLLGWGVYELMTASGDALPWWLLLGAFGWKWLCELAVLAPAARFFGVRRLLPWVLPEQVLHIVYLLYVGLAGNVGRYAWKGRRVR